MAGHVACERRGTFCTVESERSGGCVSGRGAVEESEREVWGDNNRKFFKRGFSPPRPPNSAQAWWAGGDKARLALPRRFPTSAKSVDKPLFYTYHFPPTFFLLSRSTHSGPGAVLGVHDWPSDGAGARLGARWRFRPCAKSVGKPLF